MEKKSSSESEDKNIALLQAGFCSLSALLPSFRVSLSQNKYIYLFPYSFSPSLALISFLFPSFLLEAKCKECLQVSNQLGK